MYVTSTGYRVDLAMTHSATRSADARFTCRARVELALRTAEKAWGVAEGGTSVRGEATRVGWWDEGRAWNVGGTCDAMTCVDE